MNSLAKEFCVLPQARQKTRESTVESAWTYSDCTSNRSHGTCNSYLVLQCPRHRGQLYLIWFTKCESSFWSEGQRACEYWLSTRIKWSRQFNQLWFAIGRLRAPRLDGGNFWKTWAHISNTMCLSLCISCTLNQKYPDYTALWVETDSVFIGTRNIAREHSLWLYKNYNNQSLVV